MARKHLLRGLLEDDAAGEPPAPDPPPGDAAPRRRAQPRYSKGAIGAVSQSIADLKTRSIVELDPFTIDAGGLHDRLEHDEEDHVRLMDSLRLYGQQVPILVRHHPENPDRYQIVYGRRRVLALRDLGQPVKAMIRDLDDREAILAQGQENSARRDLSFVERVNFARQMVEAGYERKIVADALSTDKTLISRMLSVSEMIPVAVIEMIGAAPGIGRDRWLAFANAWTEAGAVAQDAASLLDTSPDTGSDGRFEFLLAWLKKRAAPPSPAPKATKPAPPKRALTDRDGVTYGHVVHKGDGVKIEISAKRGRGFDRWLAENLNSIHRDWIESRGE